ncbi:MAG: Minf_1886 family protein [Terrimicrobiaceae bacterium]
MQTTGFQEAVEAVSRDDKRYHPEAYVFLRDSLEAALKRRKKATKEVGGHVAAAELLDGFRIHAIGEFGPMAMTVLEYWGVRSSEDVGHMVFNLVQAGVFGKTDEDSLESFVAGGFDFRSAFVVPFASGKNPLNGPGPDEVRSGE